MSEIWKSGLFALLDFLEPSSKLFLRLNSGRHNNLSERWKGRLPSQFLSQPSSKKKKSTQPTLISDKRKKKSNRVHPLNLKIAQNKHISKPKIEIYFLMKSIEFQIILCINLICVKLVIWFLCKIMNLICVKYYESDFCVKYYESDFWRQQYGAAGPDISLGTRKPPLSHQYVSIHCAEKSKTFHGWNQCIVAINFTGPYHNYVPFKNDTIKSTYIWRASVSLQKFRKWFQQ